MILVCTRMFCKIIFRSKTFSRLHDSLQGRIFWGVGCRGVRTKFSENGVHTVGYYYYNLYLKKIIHLEVRVQLTDNFNKCNYIICYSNARILKAHSYSHSMSGSSIWASLECHCCFWIAGGLVSYLTMWLLLTTHPLAIQKQHWHSKEAQIEPPLI
jgi:hypothetical protein